jgi:GT2 family glycosyltransferase
MERLSVSVIICAYSDERWDDLTDAIRSLDSQTVAPGEIVVVIDHNPSLLGRVQEYLGAQVIAIENDQTPGLSGGRNSGIARTSGDIVAFLDDDAIAESDWIEQLLRRFEDPEVIGAGGAIQPKWDSSRPNTFPPEFDWVFGCTYVGMPGTPAPVRNVIGCNMAFRRRVFTKLGGFRSEIGRVGKNPVGCEETEFCIRVRSAYPNHKILYDPAIRVRHRVPSQRTSWSYFRSRCFAEGKSKAVVSTMVGLNDGLSSERSHVLRTLPVGVARGVWDTLSGRDRSGFVRSIWILAGLTLAVSGYVVGLMRRDVISVGDQDLPLRRSVAIAHSEPGSD